MVEYINQLRMRGLPVREAAKEVAQLRLRPIMMTMLVATLGLLRSQSSLRCGTGWPRSPRDDRENRSCGLRRLPNERRAKENPFSSTRGAFQIKSRPPVRGRCE